MEQRNKEPWEMTRGEYEAAYGKPNGRTTLTDAWSPHKEAVAAEVYRRNENIPAAVLAEYPELARDKILLGTEHTPGPLSYNGPHDTVYDIDKEHYMAYRVTDSGGKVIAYVASLEDTKLFRAAPELLKVAEYTLSHFTPTDNPMPDQIKAREVQLVKAVKAAIAGEPLL